MLNMALICGGPSEERGISLNSSRSFIDHTSGLNIEMHIIYLNPKGQFYPLTKAQLYSNTPSDFDFKLFQGSNFLIRQELLSLLQRMDLVIPMIHGLYGEDGTLQKFLEEANVPFLGSPSVACERIFHKYYAREELKKRGFPVREALFLDKDLLFLEEFWETYQLENAVIKPAKSGSSLGVTYVNSLEKAKSAVKSLFMQGFPELILEPYYQDQEFTICVLENKGQPVALIPLEIEILAQKGEVLSYRRKYLPSTETRYHCPPRFSMAAIEEIRYQAQKLFLDFGLRDIARIDGWITKEGAIYFSDFNPLSGMEQNSFLFQQAAQAGFSHAQLLEHVLASSLSRCSDKKVIKKINSITPKQLVYVLMGGPTAERHVSIMSGTNVWLKLLQTEKYHPIPFLLDLSEKVWQLPYAYTLHHTVEEMMEKCKAAARNREKLIPLLQKIHEQMDFSPCLIPDLPEEMTLASFLEKAKKNNAFVFLGLHGGKGEDGTIQELLEREDLCFNGSGYQASKICMDKHKTAIEIAALNDPYILSMPQMPFTASFDQTEIASLWERAYALFHTQNLLIKPQCDGCSAGVVRLYSFKDLTTYMSCLEKKIRYVPSGTFSHQDIMIEMPDPFTRLFLLEPFIETDQIYIDDIHLHHKKISGWCEVTIGVLEQEDRYIALDPSITIARNHVLSLEEKFQGGTGINITPPPVSILSVEAKKQLQQSIIKIAKKLGIQNYARLDLFVECATGRIRIIEANTLPALTPSTVLFHQLLTLYPPMVPHEFLDEIIQQAQWNKLNQRMKRYALSVDLLLTSKK